MRTFRNESPVQNGHLVQRRYDFYGDDTVKRSRVTSGTIVSATSNQVYLDSAAQSVINLLKYSEDFSQSSVWTAFNNGTVTGSLILNFPIETSAFGQSNLSFDPASKTMTGQVKISGSGTVHIYLSNNVDDTSSLVLVTLTSTPTVYSVTHTFNATSGSISFTIDRRAGDTVTQATAVFVQVEYSSTVGHYVKTEGSTASDSDFYNNYGITIDSGTGAGQDHLRINDYTVSLSGSDIIRVADLSGDWLTIPDSTSKYSLIERGY